LFIDLSEHASHLPVPFAAKIRKPTDIMSSLCNMTSEGNQLPCT